MSDFSLAKRRAEVFGLSWHEHVRAVGRHGTLGIDECSKPQQLLRAQLALALLGEPTQTRFGAAHRALSYDFSVIPEYGRLRITSTTPPNLALSLLPTFGDGVPGFRLTEVTAATIRFSHIDGGLLEIMTPGGTWLSETPGLSETSPEIHCGAELVGIETLHSLSDDERTLLAAITSRLTAYIPPHTIRTRPQRQPKRARDAASGTLISYVTPRHRRGSGYTRPRPTRLSRTDQGWLLTGIAPDQYPRIVEIMTGSTGLAGCWVPSIAGDLDLRYRSTRIQFRGHAYPLDDA